ncbi:MAG: hypothetical protein OEM28_12080 [Nitrosopumilus sp.]|nr:hypothetical protein [Nitrosopumilus sp.]
MQVETVQTEELSQLDKMINEIIEQRKVFDIKLTVTGFQEKLLYTALVMLEEGQDSSSFDSNVRF